MANPSGFKFTSELICEIRNNLCVRSPVPADTCSSNWKVDATQHTFSVGGSHAAGIRTDGTVVTWGGCGTYGMLGSRSITGVPADANVGLGWASLSAGSCFTVGIKTDGTLWGWGTNNKGTLATGVASVNDWCIVCPVQVGASTTWATGNQKSSGSFTTSAAIKTDGTLWVWGSCGWGALSGLPSTSSPIQTVSGGTNWTSVTATGYSMMAVCNGTLWGWGQNACGNLGTGNTASSTSPVQTVAGGTNWSTVTSEFTSNYTTNTTVGAIKTDGTLWMWGAGNNGVLGNNGTSSQSSPVQTIAGGSTWCVIAVGGGAGGGVAGAIKTDGTLWMWGSNNCGKLGNASVIARSSPVQTVAGGTNWCAVAVGCTHSVAIKTDGTLWTWGSNVAIGTNCNSYTGARSSPVQTIAGGTTWSRVSTSVSGITHAVKTDGTLWTWGCGQTDAFGINARYATPQPFALESTLLSPTQIGAATTWANINNGLMSTKTDGTLWTWGCNAASRTSVACQNPSVFTSSPVQTVAGGTTWKQVSAGEQTVAAVKTDGTLWTWGASGRATGALGNGTVGVAVCSPVQTLTGGTNWKQVCVQLKCDAPLVGAVKTDGTMWLWGKYACCAPSNTSAFCPTLFKATGFTGSASWSCISLGDRAHALRTDGSLWKQYSPTPNDSMALVMPGTDWRTVHSGSCNNAAIKNDGTLWMWGTGGYGSSLPGLGDPACTCNAVSPVQLSGNTWTDVSFIRQGFNGLKSDGTMWGWGAINSYDAAQRTFLQALPQYCGITTSSVPTPRTVDFDDVFVRKDVFSEGGLWVWGCNGIGRLGTNSAENSVSSPVQTIAGGTNWKQVAIGCFNGGGIKSDGTLWMWGNNSSGHLGDYGASNKSSPVQTIAGGTNWKQLSIGNVVSAIKHDGSLWLWGSNFNGTLGNNCSTFDQSSPIQTIAGGNNWKQTAAGRYATAAVKTDGTLWMWGTGAFGMLGNNTVSGASSPIQTIAGGTNWKQVSLGFERNAAAIKTDGTLWTWGENSTSALGTGDNISQSSPVQTIAGGTNWKQVSLGAGAAGAVKTDGTLWMWGTAAGGKLGNNQSNISQCSPVQTIAGGNNWKQIGFNSTVTAAVKTDGTLWMWGCGTYGGLGSNTAVNRSSPVQTVAGGTNWRAVCSSTHGTMAIREDCW